MDPRAGAPAPAGTPAGAGAGVSASAGARAPVRGSRIWEKQKKMFRTWGIILAIIRGLSELVDGL